MNKFSMNKFKVGDIIQHNYKEHTINGQYSIVVNNVYVYGYKVLYDDDNSQIGGIWRLSRNIEKHCSLVTDPNILLKLNKLIIFS